MKELTFGQQAVGLQFNPSGDPEVIRVKQLYADVIDAMDALRNETKSQEARRYASTAITQAEIAQMIAVKALTWKDPVFDFEGEVLMRSQVIPVLAFFSSPTCGPCLVQYPLVQALAKETGKFHVVKIDGNKHGSLAAYYGVRGVPDMRMFKDGKEVWKGMSARALEGYIPEL